MSTPGTVPPVEVVEIKQLADRIINAANHLLRHGYHHSLEEEGSNNACPSLLRLATINANASAIAMERLQLGLSAGSPGSRNAPFLLPRCEFGHIVCLQDTAPGNELSQSVEHDNVTYTPVSSQVAVVDSSPTIPASPSNNPNSNDPRIHTRFPKPTTTLRFSYPILMREDLPAEGDPMDVGRERGENDGQDISQSQCPQALRIRRRPLRLVSLRPDEVEGLDDPDDISAYEQPSTPEQQSDTEQESSYRFYYDAPRIPPLFAPPPRIPDHRLTTPNSRDSSQPSSGLPSPLRCLTLHDSEDGQSQNRLAPISPSTPTPPRARSPTIQELVHDESEPDTLGGVKRKRTVEGAMDMVGSVCEAGPSSSQTTSKKYRQV